MSNNNSDLRHVSTGRFGSLGRVVAVLIATIALQLLTPTQPARAEAACSALAYVWGSPELRDVTFEALMAAGVCPLPEGYPVTKAKREGLRRRVPVLEVRASFQKVGSDNAGSAYVEFAELGEQDSHTTGGYLHTLASVNRLWYKSSRTAIETARHVISTFTAPAAHEAVHNAVLAEQERRREARRARNYRAPAFSCTSIDIGGGLTSTVCY